jgi:hypothetical protein
LLFEPPRSLFQLARRKIIELVLHSELESTQEQASLGLPALTGIYDMDEHLVRHAVFALVERLVKRASSQRDKRTARARPVGVLDDLDDETVWHHRVRRPAAPWMGYTLQFERRSATALGLNNLSVTTRMDPRGATLFCRSTERASDPSQLLPSWITVTASETRTLHRFLTWMDQVQDAEEQAAAESWIQSVLVTGHDMVAAPSHVPRALEFMA